MATDHLGVTQCVAPLDLERAQRCLVPDLSVPHWLLPDMLRAAAS